SSSLVNAATWALMLTGRVLREPAEPGLAAILRGAVKRLGEPVIRTAARQAMREMGRQFVLGQTIAEALENGEEWTRRGFTYSYDMLGEAAMTAGDARAYHEAYAKAIAALAPLCTGDVRDNPGISVKLSALHPRYEMGKRDRMLAELVPALARLAHQARAAGMGFNIDAEEADRLDLSLDIVEAVLSDPGLAGWDGFGVVVQTYSRRAAPLIDWLYALAERLDRRIMVRLVKGAYWDSEIKRAQVDGVPDFPVFTSKPATDIAYICCARRLIGMTDRIYPQFATHNAHTAAAVLEMAPDRAAFEFQRLHGMGERLHSLLHQREGTRCRIYAPVGAHRDLLAYLVRRLLENGANSSFVNQIVSDAVSDEEIAADPFEKFDPDAPRRFRRPARIFEPLRRNSHGHDLRNVADLERIEAARGPYRAHRWQAGPLIAGPVEGGAKHAARSPSDPDDILGEVTEAGPADIETALAAARPWTEADAGERAAILQRAADLYEENFGEIFALLARETGKTLNDAVAELREAVDFLNYYSAEAARQPDLRPVGLFACISPWNFPLAIFTGQIAAALAVGNGVLAKPAEPAPLIAALGVTLMHRAGVPREVLQLLPGRGSVIGRQITSDPRIGGVCFTGSTATAQAIHRAMAAGLDPSAPLIAETGGINAMIVDSTALPEQAVRDIIASAFQSAGQRCSALRVLYVQEDVAPRLLEMLFGAMDELALGDPWQLATDVGPVITDEARAEIAAHVDAARRGGRLMKSLPVPAKGHFIGPSVIRVGGIGEVTREVFGPVLHVATFEAEAIDRVVRDINATGYGLTFGLHTRIDSRVEEISSQLRAGNLYVNRNQIGAIVASQPFGGEGLSGTGPKAGGPHYLPRFAAVAAEPRLAAQGQEADPAAVQAALDAARPDRLRVLETLDMPGPTGESNRLRLFPRGVVLCLGPDAAALEEQRAMARAAGCVPVAVAPGASGSVS
ncbi:MAG: bifunctional proline dehydrogenase/L-glutamate gamma-semialdehyde dehydrogenase PutA, partial [Alphaproteobacteria bacterium]